MVPEELLTRCIAAVEVGENPIQVAAQYPEYATQLVPLLQTVVALRIAPKARMSGSAFAKARSTIAAAAAAQQAALQKSQNDPTQSTATNDPSNAPAISHSITTSADGTTEELPIAQPPTVEWSLLERDDLYTRGEMPSELQAISSNVPTRGPASYSSTVIPDLSTTEQYSGSHGAETPRKRSYIWPNITSVAAIASILMLIVLIAAGNGSSLPGDPLYTLKRTAEGLQRVILSATGDEANWYADQAVRRLQEALTLEAQGQPIDPSLLSEIVDNTNAALSAVGQLPTSERARFLLEWQQELANIRAENESTDQDSPVTQTLGQISTSVTNALNEARTSPTVLPLPPTATSSPEPSPTEPVATQTATSTPTATATEAAAVVQTATMQPSATATTTQAQGEAGAEPTQPPVATQPAMATAEPTQPPTAQPTATPQNTTPPQDDDDPNTATPTPQPTATPTDGPTVAPTATWTPQPTATEVPTETPTPEEPIETPTIEVTPTETPMGTPTEYPTEEPTEGPIETSTPQLETPTPTPEVTATEEATGTATPEFTPEPTVEPTATQEPTPEEPIPPPTEEPIVTPEGTPSTEETPEFTTDSIGSDEGNEEGGIEEGNPENTLIGNGNNESVGDSVGTGILSTIEMILAQPTDVSSSIPQPVITPNTNQSNEGKSSTFPEGSGQMSARATPQSTPMLNDGQMTPTPVVDAAARPNSPIAEGGEEEQKTPSPNAKPQTTPQAANPVVPTMIPTHPARPLPAPALAETATLTETLHLTPTGILTLPTTPIPVVVTPNVVLTTVMAQPATETLTGTLPLETPTLVPTNMPTPMEVMTDATVEAPTATPADLPTETPTAGINEEGVVEVATENAGVEATVIQTPTATPTETPLPLLPTVTPTPEPLPTQPLDETTPDSQE